MRSLATTCILVLALLGGGCNYTTPAAPAPPMTPAQRDFETIWQASRSVLQGYYFTLDRQDRRAGIITTMPLVGRQFGEFWRKDAVTSTELLENTLQTIYRSTVVTISEAPDQPGSYEVTVQVNVARSDRAEPQITSTSDAYSLFAPTGGKSAWITDFGRGNTPGKSERLYMDSPLDDRVSDDTPEETPAPAVAAATTQPTRPRQFGKRTNVVMLGRDQSLERRITSQITAEAIKRLGPSARVENAAGSAPPASNPGE